MLEEIDVYSMDSDSLPERVHSEVDEDMSRVPQSYLDSIDESMEKVYDSLKKKFILRRWLGTINITIIRHSKGYHTSESWMRRLTITGLNSSDVDDVKALIQNNSFTVAMNVVQLEDSSLAVEIM